MIPRRPLRIVTVVVSKVDDLERVRALEGPASAERHAVRHRELVREHVEAALAVTSIGDSVACAFLSPADAVVAATNLQRSALRGDLAVTGRTLCIGVATGEANVDEDLYGPAMVRALELAGLAEGGTVVADDVTRQLCAHVPDVAFEAHPAAGDVHHARAVPRGAEPSEILAVRAPFVGRHDARERLRRYLEGAAGGRGRFVVILGEPGIGKTRLAEEMAIEAAENGFLVLGGQCREASSEPFEPVVELVADARRQIGDDRVRAALRDGVVALARVVPGLAPLAVAGTRAVELPAGHERPYLFAAFSKALAALAETSGPVLAVLDDLHWADDATLLLVEHLVEGVPELPLVLIATARDAPGEAGNVPSLTARLRRRRLVERVQLDGLGEDEIAAMTRGMIGETPPLAFSRSVSVLTAGNPFFVEEALWHATESGDLFDDEGRVRPLDGAAPEGVRALVEHRLRRMEAHTRALIETAAVAGDDVDGRLLAGALAWTAPMLDAALDQAQAFRILLRDDVPGRDVVRFVHGLTHEAVLSALGAATRQEIHASLVSAYQVQVAEGDDSIGTSLALAHHLLAGGRHDDRVRAADVLVTVAEKEVAVGAYEPALAHLRTAEELGVEDTRQGDIDRVTGSARRGLGDVEGALSRWHVALDRYEQAGEQHATAQLAWEVANELAWHNRWAEATVLVERGLRVAGDEPTVDRALLMGATGIMLARRDPDAGAVIMRDALEMADTMGDGRLLGHLHYQEMYWHEILRDIAGAIECGERAAAFLRANGAPWELARTLHLLLQSYYRGFRYDDWRRITDELEPLARDVGHRRALQLIALEAAGWRLRRTGDVAAFEQEINTFEPPAPGFELQRRSVDAATAHRRGRWEEAIGLYENLSECGLERPVVDGYVGLVRAYLGDREGAHALLDPCLTAVGKDTTTARYVHDTVVILAIESFVLLDEPELAAALRPHIQPLLNDVGADQWLLELTGLQAAFAAGDRDEGERLAEQARRRAAELPAVLSGADARFFHGRALLYADDSDAGDRARAIALLSEASAHYGRFGMPRHQAMADELVRRARLGPAPSSASVAGADEEASVFRREGDYWLVAHEGDSARLRESKGMGYLAALLAHPGREISALELTSPEAPVTADLGSDLDAKAVADYKARILELQEDIDEAEAFGDADRATFCREELDAVVDTLSAGFGLGGRTRRRGSSAERARLSVTKAIKSTLERIETEAPAAGRHLRRFVRTGTFCCYEVDPDHPVEWRTS